VANVDAVTVTEERVSTHASVAAIEGATTVVIISPSRTTTPTATAVGESDTAVVHITQERGRAVRVAKRSRLQSTASFLYRVAVFLFWAARAALWCVMRLVYGGAWAGRLAPAQWRRLSAFHEANAPVTLASLMMLVSMLWALINNVL
jgi:hypothetical protein